MHNFVTDRNTTVKQYRGKERGTAILSKERDGENERRGLATLEREREREREREKLRQRERASNPNKKKKASK